MTKLKSLGFEVGKDRLIVYGDAASRQRKTSASATDYLLVEKLLTETGNTFYIDIPSSNPRINDRISLTNWAFRAVDGTETLYVTSTVCIFPNLLCRIVFC
jgi:hypothetical protein